MEIFGIWLSAFLTLALFSFLYKENPFYRIAEFLYVGVSAGHMFVVTFDQYLKPTVTKDIIKDGKVIYIIPVILGCLIYTRFMSKSVSWLSRIPVAYWIGIGSGIVLTKEFKSFFVEQIVATFKPLVHSDPMTMLNNILLVVGVVSTLMFFFFTKEQKGAYGIGGQIGRYTMMIAFGAAFGNTVMARFSLFLGRMMFLMGNWLHIISARV